MNKLLVPALATVVGCSPFQVNTLRAQDWATNELLYRDESLGYMRWDIGSRINFKIGEVSDKFYLNRAELVDVVATVLDAWQPFLEEFNINLNVDEGDRFYEDIDCRELYGDGDIVENGDIVICVSDEGGDISFNDSGSEVRGEEKVFVDENVSDPNSFIYGATVRLSYDFPFITDSDSLRLDIVMELISHEIGHTLGLKHPLNTDTLMSEYGIFAADDAYIPQLDTEIHGINCVYTDGCGDEILEVEEATE